MQKMTAILLASVLAGAPFQAATAQPAATPKAAGDDLSDVVIELNAMVSMRDGIKLATDIFRPAKPGRYPVILTRDPYDNGSDQASVDEGRRWAKRGYVFLHQDVRGRYDSEGSLDLYESEINDGYDTRSGQAASPGRAARWE